MLTICLDEAAILTAMTQPALMMAELEKISVSSGWSFSDWPQALVTKAGQRGGIPMMSLAAENSARFGCLAVLAEKLFPENTWSSVPKSRQQIYEKDFEQAFCAALRLIGPTKTYANLLHFEQLVRAASSYVRRLKIGCIADIDTEVERIKTVVPFNLGDEVMVNARDTAFGEWEREEVAKGAELS